MIIIIRTPTKQETKPKILSLFIFSPKNKEEIIIIKINGDDVSLDDCALFNTPASDEIEKSNLLNCSYAVSYTHLRAHET